MNINDVIVKILYVWKQKTNVISEGIKAVYISIQCLYVSGVCALSVIVWRKFMCASSVSVYTVYA